MLKMHPRSLSLARNVSIAWTTCRSWKPSNQSVNASRQQAGRQEAKPTIEINTGILKVVGEQCFSVDGEQASASKVANDVDADRVERGSPSPELSHVG